MANDVATLQAQLDGLLRIARSNERKQANFQEYQLDLLNSSGLLELLTLILEQHKERFQLSEVTLLLCDPEYEFRRLIDGRPDFPKWPNRLLFTESVHALSQYFSLQRKPRLGNFSPHLHQHLFPENQSIRSIALLPLIRQNKLIGSLNLGSRKPDRFQPDIGTLFLEHLAAVVAACLENARLNEQVRLVGLRDPLTGVNNRRFFDQRIDEEVSRARRSKQPLSCLFIDLDHFKQVNDAHGHQAGDAVLQQLAQILNESMRTSDVLARYGGEEFVILLAETLNKDAHDIADRIREKVANTHFAISASHRLTVTLSIGLATMDSMSNITSSKQLLQAADQAVYAAKLSGRNCVRSVKSVL